MGAVEDKIADESEEVGLLSGVDAISSGGNIRKYTAKASTTDVSTLVLQRTSCWSIAVLLGFQAPVIFSRLQRV